MKYHTPKMIMIISLSILLLFLVAASFLLISFGPYSPTMKAAESAISVLKEGFGGYRISFSFQERTILSKMILHDFSLYRDGDPSPLLDVDKVTLDESTKDLVLSFLKGEGKLGIELGKSDVYIPDGMLDSFFDALENLGSENGLGSFSLPQMANSGEGGAKLHLSAYSTDVTFHYPGKCIANDSSFRFSYDGFSGGTDFSLSIGDVAYERSEGEGIEATDINASYTSGDLVLSIPSFSLLYGGNDIEISGLELLLSDDLSLSVSSVSLSRGDDVYIYLSSVEVVGDDDGITFQAERVSGGYLGYVIVLDSLDGSYSSKSKVLDASFLEGAFYNQADEVFAIAPSSILLDIGSKDLDFHTKGVNIILDGMIAEGRIKGALLSPLSIHVENGTDVEAHASVSADSSLPSIASFSTDLSLYAKLDGNTLSMLDVQNDGIKYMGMDLDVDFSLSYEEDGAFEVGLVNGGDVIASFLMENGVFSFSFIPDSLDFSLLREPVVALFPFFENYIGVDTKAYGRVDGKGNLGNDGVAFQTAGDIGIERLHFNAFSFDTTLSFSLLKEKNILTLPSLRMTLPFATLDASGDMDLGNFLPSFDLNISDGNDVVLLSLVMERLGGSEVSFSLTLPVIGSGGLSGNLALGEDDTLRSDADLTLLGKSYDFSVLVDFAESVVAVENEKAFLGISWRDELVMDLDFLSFELPSRYYQSGGLLDGSVHFDFDFRGQTYTLSSTSFTLRDLTLLPSYPDFSFDLFFDECGFSVENILVTSDDYDPLSGRFRYEDGQFALALTSSGEEILFSLAPDVAGYSGLLALSSLDLGRFNSPGKVLDLSLVGSGASLEDLSFSGEVRMESTDEVNAPFFLNAEIYIDKDELDLERIVYQGKEDKIEVPSFLFSLEKGTFDLPFSYERVLENVDRNHTFSAKGRISGEFGKRSDFLAFYNTFKDGGFDQASGKVYIESMMLDEMAIALDGESDINYENSSFSFSGSLVSGNLDFSDQVINLDMAFDFNPLGRVSVKGNLSDETELEISLDDIMLYIVNPFFKGPIVVIDEETLVSGNLLVSGSPGDFHMYGYLSSERLGMDVFWLPGEHLVANNAYMSVWDNYVRSDLTEVTVIENGGERIKRGKVIVSFSLEPSLMMEYYEVDAFVEKGNELEFRFPLRSMNIDILGAISGHFSLHQDAHKNVDLKGELDATRFELSYGLHELPPWYRPTAHVEFDFDMNLVGNSSFVFPLGPNPILSATFEEGQRVRFQSDDEGFRASGQLDFRTGEIYYFQRSFFIREGGILFRDTGYGMMPVVNLRAELRDYDSRGDRVSIFLVLREATLDDFTPTFESSPQLPLNEIMQILGNAIVSNERGSSDLSSVVSLVSTGVDVLSRFGYIPAGDVGIRESIRKTFNLDTVNIHTNIIGNVVYEAFRGNEGRQVSPLARYLDGTTLYLGKYISENLYVEALFHLAADSGRIRRENNVDRWGRTRRNGTSFISNDLDLETEISVEWTNPMCTVKVFTAPGNFNIYEVVDSLGFSITKQFVF